MFKEICFTNGHVAIYSAEVAILFKQADDITFTSTKIRSTKLLWVCGEWLLKKSGVSQLYSTISFQKKEK